MREGVGGGARCLSRLWGSRGGGPHFGDSLGGFKHISGHVAGMTFWGPGPHFGGGSQVLGTPTLTQAPLGLPPPPITVPPPIISSPLPIFSSLRRFSFPLPIPSLWGSGTPPPFQPPSFPDPPTSPALTVTFPSRVPLPILEGKPPPFSVPISPFLTPPPPFPALGDPSPFSDPPHFYSSLPISRPSPPTLPSTPTPLSVPPPHFLFPFLTPPFQASGSPFF